VNLAAGQNASFNFSLQQGMVRWSDLSYYGLIMDPIECLHVEPQGFPPIVRQEADTTVLEEERPFTEHDLFVHLWFGREIAMKEITDMSGFPCFHY
jgi:hypothetical protein